MVPSSQVPSCIVSISSGPALQIGRPVRPQKANKQVRPQKANKAPKIWLVRGPFNVKNVGGPGQVPLLPTPKASPAFLQL